MLLIVIESNEKFAMTSALFNVGWFTTRSCCSIIIVVLIVSISLRQTEERIWQFRTISRFLWQECITRLDRETTEGSICSIGIALVYLIIYVAPVTEIHINISSNSTSRIMRSGILISWCNLLYSTLHPSSLINRILASAIRSCTRNLIIKLDILKRLGFLSSILCWHIHIAGVDILQRWSHGVPPVRHQFLLYPSLVIYQIALVAKLALRLEVNLMAGIAIELLALQITCFQSLISSCFIPERHNIVLDILRSLITLAIGQLGSNLIGTTISDITEVREWQTLQVINSNLGKLHWHIAIQRRNILCRSWRTRHTASIS